MAAININGNIVDPENPRPGQLPPDASNTKFVVVQCAHRLSVGDYESIQQLGIQILSVEAETPRHTSYLCKYAKDDLRALEKLDFVQHAFVYVPDFVTEPSLKESVGTSAQPGPDIAVTIRLHDTTTETGNDLLKEIKKIGRGELIDADGFQLRVRIPPSSLNHIAKLDYVKTIERTKMIEPRTVVAQDVLGAGGSLSTSTTQLLRGKGEVIAIADQGLDLGNINDIHPAFKVDGVESGASRVKAIMNYTSNPNYDYSDPNGHGTHVAACAVGVMQEELGKEAKENRVDRIRAPASEAQLVFQVISPMANAPNLSTMFAKAAGAPYNAKIHSNSWGTRSFVDKQDAYTAAESELIDGAMNHDKELLIVWAAGNDGHKLSKHDVGGGNFSEEKFVRQIGCEAAAKNVITVGATMNRRRISNSSPGHCCCVDGDSELRGMNGVNGAELWLSSSKGPTCELRLKPDVVAPGVGILSARSRQPLKGSENCSTDERDSLLDNHYKGEGKVPSRSFCFMSGTSQAAPLVASCAAVLRQALKSKPVGPITNPSGALIKALLVNGAKDLRGTSFRAPGVSAVSKSKPEPTEFLMPASPNTAQGFGEVNLEQSLKSVLTSFEGEGDALDYPPLAQGKANNVRIKVPVGKNNLRVTMAYNDKPGATIADILNLTLACQVKGAENFDKPIKPDPVVYLPWQRDAATKSTLQPVPDRREPPENWGLEFTHNNVQRISCSVVGKSMVELTVTASAITPPNGKSLGHACCWLFY